MDAHALPEARPLTGAGASPRAAALIGCGTPNTHRFVTPLVTRARLPLHSLYYKATCKQNTVPLLAAFYIVFNLFIAFVTLTFRSLKPSLGFCLLTAIFLYLLKSFMFRVVRTVVAQDPILAVGHRLFFRIADCMFHVVGIEFSE